MGAIHIEWNYYICRRFNLHRILGGTHSAVGGLDTAASIASG